MYQDHFGIQESPFSIIPDPRYLYLSPRYQEALAHLLYGIGDAGGFVMLSGEVGTGKTTVSRALLEQIPEDVDLALILNPRLSERELMATICREFGIDSPSDGASLKDFFDVLDAYLLRAHAQGRRSVLLIDEAQTLTTELLELVRLLTNLETAHKKLLQIILVGQPELSEMLAQPELRQVSQRITARFHLDPMTLDETRAYVQHRLHIGGLNQDIFTPGAIKELHNRGQGIPRLINAIAERCLLAAYAKGDRRIGTATARASANEVQGTTPRPPHWLYRLSAAVGLVGLLMAGVIAASDPYGWYTPAKPTPLALINQAPATTADAVTAPIPKKAATLRAIGQDNTSERPPAKGLDHVFSPLFTLWGIDYDTLDGLTPCDKAGSAGIQCLQGRTVIETLMAMNRPALVSLKTDDAAERVVITALEIDSVTVTDGSGHRFLSSTDFMKRWTGEFLILWKPPQTIGRTLSLGMNGADVKSLRDDVSGVLKLSDDNGIARAAPDVFDDALKRQVEAFQQREGLPANGVADRDTLLRLMAITNTGTGPVLGGGIAQ